MLVICNFNIERAFFIVLEYYNFMSFFNKKEKEIYLDYVSSTPVSKEVLEVMKPYWNEKYGNAGENHKFGRETKRALDESREKIAKIFDASVKEIIFTSGGTESNNLAILGFFNQIKKETGTLNGYHAITSEIEHSSVLKTFKHLEKEGLNVSYIKVDENGIIDLKEFTENIKEKTIFVSIMMINNEIGTIQPISEIAKIIRKNRKIFPKNSIFPNSEFPIFHTDASQSPLFLDLNVKKLGVDMLTIDGQKIYGPKGVGALYIKNEIKIQPLFFGGSQEFGLRPGTENISLIVGLSKALEIASNKREEVSNKILKLREYFINKIKKEIPDSKLNGSMEHRAPNNVNVSFKNVDHEYLVVQLDESGIFCSTKSSCLNKKDSDSYVLNAINRGKIKTGGVRFSLGKETTKDDLDYVIEKLKKFV